MGDGIWSTPSCARHSRTCMRPATSHCSTIRRSAERLRVEHEDNANTMGKQAGQSMAGETGLLRSPPVLLLGPVRPRLRGGRASSTRGWRRWPTGRSRTARAWSTTCAKAGCAACCCGTSGAGRRGPRSDRRRDGLPARRVVRADRGVKVVCGQNLARALVREPGSGRLQVLALADQSKAIACHKLRRGFGVSRQRVSQVEQHIVHHLQTPF